MGLSIADMTTETSIYETQPAYDDNRYILDEIFRFIQSHSPKEMIIHTENLEIIGWDENSLEKVLKSVMKYYILIFITLIEYS